MANFVYNHFKHLVGSAGTGANLTTADFRVLFVMTNTTAGPLGTDNSGTDAEDVLTVGGFDDLDEYDGSGHPAGGIALTYPVSQVASYTKNAANNRSELDADDVLFSALAAGTRQAAAAFLYSFISDLASSIPVAWYDSGGFPFTGSGSDVTIQWNAGGVLQVT